MLITAAWLCTGVAAASTAATPTPRATPSPSPAPETECPRAAAALTAHWVETALAGYASILDRQKDAACAIEGMRQASAARVDSFRLVLQAQALAAAGEDAEALDTFAAALAINAESVEALAGIASPSPKPSVDTFATAKGLIANGFATAASESAKKVLEASLKKDPNAQLPPELRYVAGQQGPVTTWMTTGPLASVGAAWNEIGVALVALVVFVGMWLWFRRRRRPLAIVDFGAEAIDKKFGASVAHLIGAELSELARVGGGASLRYSQGIDDDLKGIPDAVAEAVPNGKLVREILQFLSGRQTQVTGELLATGGKGQWALAVAYRDRRRTYTATFGWQTYGGSQAGEAAGQNVDEAFALLPLAAASWTAYWLVDRSDPALPTGVWESYAAYRVGAALQARGEGDRARSLYARALDHDPRNRAALLNLGSLDVNVAPSNAIARLEKAKVILGALPNDVDRRSWYRATFNLAIAQYMRAYLLEFPGTPTGTCVDEAEATTIALIRAAIDYLHPSATLPRPEIVFYEHVILSGVVLLASIRRVKAPDAPPPQEQGRIEPWDCAALKEHLGNATEQELLRFAGVPDRLTLLPSEVVYNAACHYGEVVTSDEELEIAWRALELACDNPSLARMAQDDPSLRRLKDKEPDRFRKVTRQPDATKGAYPTD